MKERRQSPRQPVSLVRLTTTDSAFAVADLSMAGALVHDDGALGETGTQHVGALVVPLDEGTRPLPMAFEVVHRAEGRCGVKFIIQSVGAPAMGSSMTGGGGSSLAPLARYLEGLGEGVEAAG
ncbi:MAG: PilZ domain-containing protein [Bradymonadia bacterium]